MNIFTLMGNLGGDPEVRHSPSGGKVTTFSIATSKDKVTTWYKIVVFGDRMDKMMTYLKKGSGVCVVGELKPPTIYQGKAGPSVSLEVIADKINFLPSKKDEAKAEAPEAKYGDSFNAVPF